MNIPTPPHENTQCDTNSERLYNCASYGIFQFTDEVKEEHWNLSKFPFWPKGTFLMCFTDSPDPDGGVTFNPNKQLCPNTNKQNEGTQVTSSHTLLFYSWK